LHLIVHSTRENKKCDQGKERSVASNILVLTASTRSLTVRRATSENVDISIGVSFSIGVEADIVPDNEVDDIDVDTTVTPCEGVPGFKSPPSLPVDNLWGEYEHHTMTWVRRKSLLSFMKATYENGSSLQGWLVLLMFYSAVVGVAVEPRTLGKGRAWEGRQKKGRLKEQHETMNLGMRTYSCLPFTQALALLLLWIYHERENKAIKWQTCTEKTRCYLLR
jgi:hypothetical protein